MCVQIESPHNTQEIAHTSQITLHRNKHQGKGENNIYMELSQNKQQTVRNVCKCGVCKYSFKQFNAVFNFLKPVLFEIANAICYIWKRDTIFC